MWLKVARAGEKEGKDLGDRVVGPGQAARVAKAAKRMQPRRLGAV